MRTNFRAEQLSDPHMQEAEKALRTCIHCGFCTATCPTYLVLGDERDGPRGRIVLMQNMLESGALADSRDGKASRSMLVVLGCKTALSLRRDLFGADREIARLYRRELSAAVGRPAIPFVHSVRADAAEIVRGHGGAWTGVRAIVSRLPGSLV
jgi:Fe-S oxidoreductase